jgi:hypothetical protein
MVSLGGCRANHRADDTGDEQLQSQTVRHGNFSRIIH